MYLQNTNARYKSPKVTSNERNVVRNIVHTISFYCRFVSCTPKSQSIFRFDFQFQAETFSGHIKSSALCAFESVMCVCVCVREGETGERESPICTAPPKCIDIRHNQFRIHFCRRRFRKLVPCTVAAAVSDLRALRLHSSSSSSALKLRFFLHFVCDLLVERFCRARAPSAIYLKQCVGLCVCECVLKRLHSTFLPLTNINSPDRRQIYVCFKLKFIVFHSKMYISSTLPSAEFFATFEVVSYRTHTHTRAATLHSSAKPNSTGGD